MNQRANGGPRATVAKRRSLNQRPADYQDGSIDSWALVALIQNGDTEAFELFYKRYYSFVYGYMFKRLNNRQAAEDLTADVFLKMFRGIEKIDNNGADLAKWVSTVAHHQLMDHYRRCAIRPETLAGDIWDLLGEPPDDRTDTDPESCLERPELINALKQLTPRRRRMVVLRILMDLSVPDTAELMGCTEGTVKSTLSRAIHELAERLNGSQSQHDNATKALSI